jgi:hypothetical protein
MIIISGYTIRRNDCMKNLLLFLFFLICVSFLNGTGLLYVGTNVCVRNEK